MQKFIVATVLAIIIIVSIIADIWKRNHDGIPDANATGIQTLTFAAAPQVGAASVEISQAIKHQPKWNTEEARLDSLIRPFADFSLPDEKNKPNFRRKTVNRFFLKALVLANRDQKAVFISVEIPQLNEEQITAIHDTLERGLGIPSQNVTIFSTGVINNYTAPAAALAKNAANAVANALATASDAEFTVIRTDSGMPPANLGHVSIDVGTLDLPPLCGPQIMNRQYDATGHANAWLASLSDSTTPFPPLAVTTTPLQSIQVPLVVFRTRERNIIGGFMLSPYLPCITPPTELGGDISSDYIFHAMTFIEKKLGGTFLFLRSPGADVIPFIDNFSHANAHSFGLRISSTLSQCVKKASWEKIHNGWFYTAPLSLPVKPSLQEPIERLYASIQKYRLQLEQIKKTSVSIETKRSIQDLYLDALYQYNNARAHIAPAPASMRALRINKTLLLALQGEYFYATGAAIAGRHPDIPLLIADNMEHSTSFIVPETLFAGGYRANRTCYAKGAEAAVINAADNFITAIKPFSASAEK